MANIKRIKARARQMGVATYAGGILLIEPMLNGVEKIADHMSYKGRDIADRYRDTKDAIEEDLAQRQIRKSVARAKEAEKILVATEEEMTAKKAHMPVDPSGVSPAHRHDLEEYQNNLREEFADFLDK
ncbi:MAG: hypothetical protein E6R03_11090 [Hyphomicrobiaceae bacterium]|nr:MAG: hypothetical protein E6R03_11090 [Hyphomicrobiaceae bacterium]